MNVANLIVKILEYINTEHIFGLPGTQTLPFYDALYDSSINHVLVRHEQTASQAADAYAKVSGKIGICDSSLGPGALNMAIGIGSSWIDSSPIIALTGDRPMKTIGKGAFQHIDTVSIFRPITKWSTCLSEPSKTLHVFRTAHRIALGGRPGPVHIVVPEDILRTEIEENFEYVSKDMFKQLSKPKAAPKLIKKAVDMLLQAERPVILAGGGCNYSSPGAPQELMKLAELLWIPVACTLNGRGCFPEDHPLSVGRTGVVSARYVNHYIQQADVLLALGCRFADLSTNHWNLVNPETKIIQVDIDPSEIGKNHPVKVGIVGDAKSTLSDIISTIKKKIPRSQRKHTLWLQVLTKGKSAWLDEIKDKITSDKTPLKPQRVMKEIRNFFDRQTIFTLDAGEHKLLASTYIDIYEHGTWINSGEFGPMGYGLPAAIGCKVAKPEHNIVVIAGDGGFSMTIQELATCVKHELPVICCLFNNGCLASIKTYQRVNYESRFLSSDYINCNPDFANVAKAFHCHGIKVEKSSEILPALESALKTTYDGIPCIIEFITDPLENPIRV